MAKVGICLVDIAQSLAVNPLSQTQEPLTHLPLKVQSFGHSLPTMSDRRELSGFALPLEFVYEDRFLPTIPPHSFNSTATEEIAKDVSPVN